MRKLLNSFLLLFLSIALAACATVTPQAEAPKNATVDWDNRVQLLSSIHTWDLKGMIAVRAQASAESATLQWQQNKQNFALLLLGPLGTNAYKLSGHPGKVELETPKGQKFYAKNAETLLAEQTGWKLPVSNLYYWVRGLPVPGVAAEKQFDKYNHLTELKQQGWKIQYLRYTSTARGDLPSKIFIDYPQLNVKIIISRWQF